MKAFLKKHLDESDIKEIFCFICFILDSPYADPIQLSDIVPAARNIYKIMTYEEICGACKEPYEEPNEYDGFCSFDCLQNFNLD